MVRVDVVDPNVCQRLKMTFLQEFVGGKGQKKESTWGV